jgi:hypothetical protein
MAKIANARRGTNAISSSPVTYIGELRMHRRKVGKYDALAKFVAVLGKKW